MPHPSHHSRWILIFAILVVVIGGSIYFALHHRNESPQPPEIRVSEGDPAVTRLIEQSREAIRRDPHSGSAWGHLGMVLAAHELAAPAAEICFQQAETLDADQPRWPYHQAMLLIGRGDYDAAISKLQRAAELAKEREPAAEAPIRIRFADLLLGQGKSDLARDEFNAVISKNPLNSMGRLGLLRIEVERNAPGVIGQLAALRADPQVRKAAQTLLGQAELRTGNKDAATAELFAAERLPADPPTPDPFQQELIALRTGKRVRLARADALLSAGKAPQALETTEGIVTDYPDEALAWLLRGRALILSKDPAEAIKALDRAAHLDPASPQIEFYAGAARYLEDDRAGAAAHFRRAAELEPTFAVAWFNLATCLAEQGNNTAATEAAQSALVCRPGYVEAHLLLADLFSKAGRHNEAVEQLNDVIRLDPANAAARSKLAELQRR